MSAPESQAPTGTRQRLGRYELLGEIASGGMATVHLARVLGLQGFSRLVAIKRLHKHLESDEDFVAMFLDEARLAARIRHPNVVPTLDVVADDGFYIVMEYVEGDRLAELIRHCAKNRTRIDPAVVLKISVDALEGLHAAHELRDDDGDPLHLVHRDVSPQNVMVGVDGVAKIVDFGIAKAASRLSQTREGQLKGKLSYMAPEQMTQRERVDRRVDIFAMGIIVWESLCGRRLFKGESDVETLGAVLNDPIPSPRAVLPNLPVGVESVVMKALERDPERRYATAAEFAAALEKSAQSLGGLASARTVAAFVQAIAGPKIERELWRLKSDPDGRLKVTPPPIATHALDEVSNSAVRLTSPGAGVSIDPRFASATGDVGGVRTASANPWTTRLFVGVGVLCLLVAAILFATRRGRSRDASDQPGMVAGVRGVPNSSRHAAESARQATGTAGSNERGTLRGETDSGVSTTVSRDASNVGAASAAHDDASSTAAGQPATNSSARSRGRARGGRRGGGQSDDDMVGQNPYRQ